MPTMKSTSSFRPTAQADFLRDGEDRDAEEAVRNESLSRWADDFLDTARERRMAFWKARGAYHPHEIQHPWEG